MDLLTDLGAPLATLLQACIDYIGPMVIQSIIVILFSKICVHADISNQLLVLARHRLISYFLQQTELKPLQ